MLDNTQHPICKVVGGNIPSYSHSGDAGADLRASEDGVISAKGKGLISTGVCIALPPGHVGLVWPRSGLAVKKGIDCGAGVIDSQYRGEVRVLLFNHSDEDFSIKKGDRIAQLLIQKIETAVFVPVERLDDTSRGEGGFGSTGQ